MTRRRLIVAALGVVLLVAVALGIFWFGWRELVDYINPKNATDRKDAVQVYAIIVAGVVAAITAGVGFANLWLTRRNLEQQRELAQGTALQAYYAQIGKLLTDEDLLNTQRKEIRELARGQTLTVLQEVDGKGKASLLTFLHAAGLLEREKPAIALARANLRGARLNGANLYEANLERANLRKVSFHEADLQGVDLRGADLRGADLHQADLYLARLNGANLERANSDGADLRGARLNGANLRAAVLDYANLQGAKVTDEQLADTRSLQAATMPNGQSYEDWRKDEEGSGKDVENE